jgi:hypothetical protein
MEPQQSPRLPGALSAGEVMEEYVRWRIIHDHLALTYLEMQDARLPIIEMAKAIHAFGYEVGRHLAVLRAMGGIPDAAEPDGISAST